jgi:protein TonB
MNATIASSFPAMHSFKSPRGVALAFIVLLHVAFFFALSSGLGTQIVKLPPPIFRLVEPPNVPSPPRTAPHIPVPSGDLTRIDDPSTPKTPPIDLFDPPKDPPVVEKIGDGPRIPEHVAPDPIVVPPEEDAAHQLSAPAYPAAEIRSNHAGTVIVRVQVLENGHIGDVQLVQSSGFQRLDESALREAKRWRMKPGTRDGVPVVMWKEVPITFQLKDRGATDL